MNFRAKKSLGQHFLTSKLVLAQIISAAALKPGERVLEIGPGTGILTEALLAAGAKLTAIEKDDRAIGFLQRKFALEIAEGRLNLIHGDVLESDTSLLASCPTPYALVANIPYYITGAILEKFLEYGPQPDRMILLVQKEVAERIVAHDGKESVLSLSVKAFGRPRIISIVPGGAFNPPPSVDSAIMAIDDINDRAFREHSRGRQPLDIKKFFMIVRAGFAHKRKFLLRNLEAVAPLRQLESIWHELEMDSKMRAEEVPVKEWLRIAEKIELGSER